MREKIKILHTRIVYFAGSYGFAFGLIYLALTGAKIGILAKILPKSASNWVYAMLTTIISILPYLAGLLGLFILILSVIYSIGDIKKWNRKRKKLRYRKNKLKIQTTKIE